MSTKNTHDNGLTDTDRARPDGGNDLSDTPAIVETDADAAAYYRGALKQLRLLHRKAPNENRMDALQSLRKDLKAVFSEGDTTDVEIEPITHAERRQVAGTTVIVRALVYDDGDLVADARSQLAATVAIHGADAIHNKFAEVTSDGDA